MTRQHLDTIRAAETSLYGIEKILDDIIFAFSDEKFTNSRRASYESMISLSDNSFQVSESALYLFLKNAKRTVNEAVFMSQLCSKLNFDHYSNDNGIDLPTEWKKFFVQCFIDFGKRALDRVTNAAQLWEAQLPSDQMVYTTFEQATAVLRSLNANSRGPLNSSINKKVVNHKVLTQQNSDRARKFFLIPSKRFPKLIYSRAPAIDSIPCLQSSCTCDTCTQTGYVGLLPF